MNNLVEGINLSWYAFSDSEKKFQDKIISAPMIPFHEDGSNLTITFLSLNRSSLSIRLLNSIKSCIPEFKGNILIFDNGSNLEELENLKKNIRLFEFSIELYESKENLGVAGGRNKTSEIIKTDWFLSLDNDVYFIENPLSSIKECIDKLGVHFLNLPLLNSDGHTIFAAGGNLFLGEYKDSYAIGCPSSFKQTLKFEVDPTHPFLSTCLFGTAAVIRTDSFIEQEGFDSNMFIGFEDLDFSLRLYKKGIKIGNTNKFCAVHGHEPPLVQSDADYERVRFSKKTIIESGAYFYKKHNIYAWTEGVDDWLTSREKELKFNNEKIPVKLKDDTTQPNNYIDPKLQNFSQLPKIALIVDIKNWAFDRIANQIIKFLGQSYDFQIFDASSYDNLGHLMLDVQKFDLIHFFWRADLFRLLDSWTQHQFAEKGWDYKNFITNVIAEANITTSIYDHLFLTDNEIQERKMLFNALSIEYTTVSERLYKIYSSIKEYPKPISVIEDGVDLEVFKPSRLERLSTTDREIVVGWVGNSNWGGDNVDHKGISTIIKPAIESLQKEGYKIKGLFADRQECWLPHKDMSEYYNSLDIYVCASDIEGTPNPILESMACGIPIITTDVGMVPQLFGPLQKKYILPIRSIDALKDKLKDLIADPMKRVALSGENLESIKKWTWRNQSIKWDSFFKKVLADSLDKNIIERRNFSRKQILESYFSIKSAKDAEDKINEMVANEQYEELKALSNQLQLKINLMEQSKFWRIRSQWFNVKQKLGFSKDKY